MSGRTLFKRISEDPRVLNRAWDEVHRNAKSLSKGIDETTLSTYAAHSQKNLSRLRLSIKNGSFKFSNLRGAALLKPNGKYRPLKIATIEDRIVQKAIELLIRKPLNNSYNLFNNPVSYAFIKTEDINEYNIEDPQTFKGVRGAVEKLRAYYSEGYSWCLRADIIDFFGNVDVDYLLNKFIFPVLAPDVSLNTLISEAFKQEVQVDKSIQDLLKSQGEEEYQKFLKNNGLPQGSILSPMFSNVYLANFDQVVAEEGLIVIRYVDDMIIVTKTKKQAEDAHKVIVERLKDLSLNIHPLGSSKTSIQETKDVTFLGIRLKDGNLYPSEAAYKKLIDKLSKYPKYKTFLKNIQSLRMLSQSWASTYYFCSPDKNTYESINKALDHAVERTLHKARLAPRVKLGNRELRRLGIYQFDNAIVIYRQKHKT